MFLALDPVTTDTRDHELIEAAETVLAMYRRGIITYASMGTGLTILDTFEKRRVDEAIKRLGDALQEANK